MGLTELVDGWENPKASVRRTQLPGQPELRESIQEKRGKSSRVTARSLLRPGQERASEFRITKPVAVAEEPTPLETFRTESTPFGNLHQAKFIVLHKGLKTFLKMLRDFIISPQRVAFFAEKREFSLLSDEKFRAFRIANLPWNSRFEAEKIAELEDLASVEPQSASLTRFLLGDGCTYPKKIKFEKEDPGPTQTLVDALRKEPADDAELPPLINLFFRYFEFSFEFLGSGHCEVIYHVKLLLVIAQLLAILDKKEGVKKVLAELRQLIREQLANKVVILYLPTQKEILETSLMKIDDLEESLATPRLSNYSRPEGSPPGKTPMSHLTGGFSGFTEKVADGLRRF